MQRISELFGEVNHQIQSAFFSPNFIKVSTRMSSLESMLHIVSENPQYADNFTVRLVRKYRLFNKRYFPDSQVKKLFVLFLNFKENYTLISNLFQLLVANKLF